MKFILKLFLLIIFFYTPAFSQEEEVSEENLDLSEPQRPVQQMIEISRITWNNELKIQDGVILSKDPANYMGTLFSYHRETGFPKWGWSSGVFIATGRAVGGGLTSLASYKKNQVGFVLLGLSPRAFYRISRRVNAGASLRLFYRSVQWPQNSETQNIDAGKSLNLTTLVDVNFRLTPHWDFQTALGPLYEGSTFWQMGFKYRF